MDKKEILNSHFSEFSSIENCKKKYINDLQKYGYIDSVNEWVAMEKIHGANFSFITDGIEIITARRSATLQSDEKFYGHQLIAEKYKSDVLQIHSKIKLDIPNITTIQIFGELFGGYYPGRKNIMKPVQKEVLYNNEVDFLVFDIKANTRDLDKIDSFYLSQDEVDLYLANLLLLRGAPVLARGKFSDIIDMNPVFPTTVPLLYHLSPIEGNVAEGYVFKLNKRHSCQYTRPIIKHKNKTFKEVSAFTPKILSDNSLINQYIEKALAYCTQNRFNNTISKIGPDNRIEKIQGIFIADVITDMKKDLELDELEEFHKIIKKIKEGLTYRLMHLDTINTWLTEYNNPITIA